MPMIASKTTLLAYAGFSVYFGLFLVQKIAPNFAGTTLAFLLALSVFITLPTLVLLAVWSAGALVRERLFKKPMGRFSRSAGRIASAGIVTCAGFLLIGGLIATPLPSGSYDSPFNRELWLEPASTRYVKGGITPRQKMLGDVISKLPGKNRAELEMMLGPSPKTGYFEESGRDLLYLTGPQRDTFFSIDSEWLLIWLDENGVYKRHAVVAD